MKQILLYLTKVLVPAKRKFLVSFFLLVFGSISSQNGIIGSGFGTNDWSTINSFSSGAGDSRIFTATPNGIGNQYFRLVRNWAADFTQFGPFGCIDTDWTNPGVVYGMSVCGGGAFFINCPISTDNYVFKTPNGDTSMDLLYFRVQGAIRNISTVIQSPLAASVTECHATTVTATLDGALSAGQQVYMCYTKDDYVTSTVVLLTGTGTKYTGTIPSVFNTAGANVSYYVFTSGDSNVASDGSNADFYTINLNNNGGSNYSYGVNAGGATTYVPDNNFEQALIDLGLDCALDDYVFTSNLSDVTLLDIRDKNITSLVGINDFTNLKYLYCANNSLTSLNISGLTNLWELVVNNNLISSLDVSSSPDMYYLDCERNLISNLNISGLTRLQTLIVWVNKLTSLDVSNNPDLTYLDCDDNLFTSVNVMGLNKLETFYCSGNQFASLNVSTTADLKIFYCYNNIPAGIDIFVANVQDANTKDWRKDPASIYTYCQTGLNTTWDGSSWNNGVPSSGTAAIISGNYNVAANIDACSLTVNNNAVVTIPSGYNVTLNAPVTVEIGSSFTLNNNANLIQTNKNSINTGVVSVKRNSNPLYRLDYTLWSSPVSGALTLAGFSPLTSQSPSRFYSFDTSYNIGGVNGAYIAIATPTTTSFNKGAGYLIRMPNTDPLTGYDAGTANLSYTGIFTGLPNNGDVPATLSFIDAPRSYNLVGNPYPSVIDSDVFITENTANIENTLYFWRKTNAALGSAYATYTAGVGGTATLSSEIPNGKIQVGQGFFVQAKSAGTITNFFTNAMRDASPTSTQVFKIKQLAQKDRVWINLTSTAGVFSQALVAYIGDATQGVDKYDGKYINDSKIALTSNINNEEYTIQSRPSFNVADVVALNFKTDLAGDYTIAIDHADGLFANGQDVYLVDSITGVETNLKTSSYSFTAIAGMDNARFSLKYQKTLKVDATVFDENSVAVFKTKGTLFVNSGAITINNIKVYDIQGRLIAEQKNVKANSAIIKDLKANQQVLIVKITSQDNRVVSKKIVY